MSSSRKPITYTNYATYKNKVIYARYFSINISKSCFHLFRIQWLDKLYTKAFSSYRASIMLLLLHINPFKASQYLLFKNSMNNITFYFDSSGINKSVKFFFWGGMLFVESLRKLKKKVKLDFCSDLWRACVYSTSGVCIYSSEKGM